MGYPVPPDHRRTGSALPWSSLYRVHPTHYLQIKFPQFKEQEIWLTLLQGFSSTNPLGRARDLGKLFHIDGH